MARNGITIRVLRKKEFAESMMKKTAAILAAEGKAIAQATRLVEGTAKTSIAKEGSFREYISRITKVSHWSSQPGSPPASDTGNLANNISSGVEKEGNSWVGRVISRAIYSAWLEFGTKHIEARPFMFPALFDNRKKIRKLVRDALVKGLNK